jgi:glycosyltransferase involved in cell wall biosynthesis
MAVSTDTAEPIFAAAAPASVTAPPPPAARVLLIAENASFRFGGEAILPLHYFRVLRNRGVPVWLITNERNRAELTQTLAPADLERIDYIPDGQMHRWLGKLSCFLPQSVSSFTIGQLIEVVDQVRARRLARRMIPQHAITVVHQPTPVSPKHVSMLHGLGVPVVMGPMNGGINYPRCFRNREQWIDRVFVPAGRMLADVVNRLMPGKLRAATLMVANDRTAAALPRGARGQVKLVVENGVNLEVYRRREQLARFADAATAGRPVRFAFAGRLVHWKGVDLLLEAVKQARTQVPLQLDVMGDGRWRKRLEDMARALGVDDVVRFRGWMSHQACAAVLAESDVLVLPSLRECGGAAVLEAMAMRLPVIATKWGGPADYIDETCGILVEPRSHDQFVADLGAAMVRLAQDPALRERIGAAGYDKIMREYDWERKVDQVLAVYREAVRRTAPSADAVAALAR